MCTRAMPGDQRGSVDSEGVFLILFQIQKSDVFNSAKLVAFWKSFFCLIFEKKYPT